MTEIPPASHKTWRISLSPAESTRICICDPRQHVCASLRSPEPWRRGISRRMQQSATLSNDSVSLPSQDRLHEPSTRQGARHQIRSNSDIIKSIWEASLLGNLRHPDTGRSILEPDIEPSFNSHGTPSLSTGTPSHRDHFLVSWQLCWHRLDIFYTLPSFWPCLLKRPSWHPFRTTSVARWKGRALGLAVALFPHFPNTTRSCKRFDRRGSPSNIGREGKRAAPRRVWHAAHRHTEACVPVICQFPIFP